MKIKKNYTFHFFEDYSHGWLRVNKNLISHLGIEKEITPYSYVNGKYIYLEEDCDYVTFYNKMRDFGLNFTVKNHFSKKRSRIRRFERFETL